MVKKMEGSNTSVAIFFLKNPFSLNEKAAFSSWIKKEH
jgi:hypothetical protein